MFAPIPVRTTSAGSGSIVSRPPGSARQRACSVWPIHAAMHPQVPGAAPFGINDNLSNRQGRKGARPRMPKLSPHWTRPAGLKRPESRAAGGTVLLPNLPADCVLLLIERFLIGSRDMAVVEFRHRPFLVSDCSILRVQTLRLSSGYLTLSTLGIDTPVLILQTIIHLVPPRMSALPLGLSYGARHRARHQYCSNGKHNSFGRVSHVLSLSRLLVLSPP